MIVKLNEITKSFEDRLLANNIRGYALALEFTKLQNIETTDARFSNNDYRTDAITMQLLIHDEPIRLEEGTVVYVNIRKPDSTQVFQGCNIIDADNGIVMLRLMRKSLNLKGECTLEVVVVPSEDEKLVSPKIIYTVYDSLDGSNDTEIDEDQTGIINGLVGEILNLAHDLRKEELKRDKNEKDRLLSETNRVQTYNQLVELTKKAIADIDMVRITNEEIDEIFAEIIGG